MSSLHPQPSDFTCHLTAAVSYPVAGRIAIAADDLPRCLENSAEPLQAFGIGKDFVGLDRNLHM